MIKKNHDELDRGRREAVKLGITMAERHVLMCVDRKTAKCASRKQMEYSWKHLKKRLKELQAGAKPGVFRTKTYCLGICMAGPILVVMPDGIWYGHCTTEVIDRIVQEHLIDGNIVAEYVLAHPPNCAIG